jgi:hypothetical protein
MLVQLDHIALTAEDLSRHDAFLQALGYECVFSYRGIPNPENKRELMGEWSDSHSLVLYKRGESIPIELIDYGYTVESHDPYKLPFEVFTSSQNCTRLEGIEKQKTTSSEESRHLFDHVCVRTPVPNESRKFWADLGLTQLAEEHLQYDSPLMDHPITVELQLSPITPGSSLLDGKGFRCLAFVTNSIEEELGRLSDLGYTTTSIRRIDLPHRSMQLAFVIGPAHEPVELVSPV